MNKVRFSLLVVFLGMWIVGSVALESEQSDEGRENNREKEGQEQEVKDPCNVPSNVISEIGSSQATQRKALVTVSELRRWGPIEIKAVINCQGDLVDIEILSEVPAKLRHKIQKKLEKGWISPATAAR